MSKDPVRFKVTEDHIKLLRRAEVGWNGAEYGAPTIDPKRPYGNSDVEVDVIEILAGGEDVESLTDGERSIAYSIHAETETALQIFLQTGKMEPGVYINHALYGNDWRKVVE